MKNIWECETDKMCCSEIMEEYTASIDSWSDMNDDHFDEWLQKQDICYECSKKE